MVAMWWSAPDITSDSFSFPFCVGSSVAAGSSSPSRGALNVLLEVLLGFGDPNFLSGRGPGSRPSVTKVFGGSVGRLLGWLG